MEPDTLDTDAIIATIDPNFLIEWYHIYGGHPFDLIESSSSAPPKGPTYQSPPAPPSKEAGPQAKSDCSADTAVATFEGTSTVSEDANQRRVMHWLPAHPFIPVAEFAARVFPNVSYGGDHMVAAYNMYKLGCRYRFAKRNERGEVVFFRDGELFWPGDVQFCPCSDVVAHNPGNERGALAAAGLLGCEHRCEQGMDRVVR